VRAPWRRGEEGKRGGREGRGEEERRGARNILSDT